MTEPQFNLNQALQGLQALTGGNTNLGGLASFAKDPNIRSLVEGLTKNSQIQQIANDAFAKIQGQGAQAMNPNPPQAQAHPPIDPEVITNLTDSLHGLASAQADYLSAQAQMMRAQTDILTGKIPNPALSQVQSSSIIPNPAALKNAPSSNAANQK